MRNNPRQNRTNGHLSCPMLWRAPAILRVAGANMLLADCSTETGSNRGPRQPGRCNGLATLPVTTDAEDFSGNFA